MTHHDTASSLQAMPISRALHLWNEWEIQILVIVSFALQVLLLSFAWMRRLSISHSLRILLWLMYLLAEYTATYALGHMSLIGGKAGEHQQLMAFWAPFLLMHLGGQDTITAYAIEDSQLWLRHLLTFAVQALGAGYVLYKYMGSRGPLVAPAILMFTLGVLKNVERVSALSFSRLEIIRRYLDGVAITENNGDYPTAGTQSSELDDESVLQGASTQSLELDVESVQGADTQSLELHGELVLQGTGTQSSELDDESVLQGAHDLLYICLGQFVDYKICPTKFQNNAMKYFHKKGKTFELVELQLSLMYDIFYTKAAVIHTWYGRCFRAISLLGTAMVFFLFQFSTAGKDGYSRVDVAVTYILVTGAFILEAASVLRAMWSTWTCNMLRVNSWDRLHSLHVSLRRCFGKLRIAQARRWPGSIGQLNLLDSYCYKCDEISALFAAMGLVSISAVKKDKAPAPSAPAPSLCSKLVSFYRDCSSRIYSTAAKELVLEEIQRMVEACQGNEGLMRSYRGQCALEQPDKCIKADPDHTRSWSFPDGILKDVAALSKVMEFDENILAWHLATDEFLTKYSKSTDAEALSLVEATKAVSNYMMFLLVERPYMLPSPVRPTLHLHAKKVLQVRPRDKWFEKLSCFNKNTLQEEVPPQLLNPGAEIARQLLSNINSGVPWPELLRVVFGVWVEMMCYAAHHCSRESHARQLSSGGELITTVWLLTTAEFDRVHYSQKNFKERKHGSVWNYLNSVDFRDFMLLLIAGMIVLIVSPIYFCIYAPLYLSYRVICFLWEEMRRPRKRRSCRPLCM